jgi:hypothetical protein
MKTFFIKKGKGATPVVGASVLTKKPDVGSYVSFNVPTDNVMVECTLDGEFDVSPLTGNKSILADTVEITVITIGGGSSEYSYVNLYFSMPTYGSPHTVDQLLEMMNRRAGGMVYFVLQNNKIYLTRSSLTSAISTVTIDSFYD